MQEISDKTHLLTEICTAKTIIFFCLQNNMQTTVYFIILLKFSVAKHYCSAATMLLNSSVNHRYAGFYVSQ